MVLAVYLAEAGDASSELTGATGEEADFGALAAAKKSEGDSFISTTQLSPFSSYLSLFESCQPKAWDRSTSPVPCSLSPWSASHARWPLDLIDFAACWLCHADWPCPNWHLGVWEPSGVQPGAVGLPAASKKLFTSWGDHSRTEGPRLSRVARVFLLLAQRLSCHSLG